MIMNLILKRRKEKIAVIKFLFQFNFQPRVVKSNCELTRPKCEVKLRFYGNATQHLKRNHGLERPLNKTVLRNTK